MFIILLPNLSLLCLSYSPLLATTCCFPIQIIRSSYITCLVLSCCRPGHPVTYVSYVLFWFSCPSCPTQRSGLPVLSKLSCNTVCSALFAVLLWIFYLDYFIQLRVCCRSTSQVFLSSCRLLSFLSLSFRDCLSCSFSKFLNCQFLVVYKPARLLSICYAPAVLTPSIHFLSVLSLLSFPEYLFLLLLSLLASLHLLYEIFLLKFPVPSYCSDLLSCLSHLTCLSCLRCSVLDARC